jgi:hypothetical protein
VRWKSSTLVLTRRFFSLGCRFGQFESWLQNKNIPDGEIDKKFAALADDINEDLEGLNSGYRITMDTKSK